MFKRIEEVKAKEKGVNAIESGVEGLKPIVDGIINNESAIILMESYSKNIFNEGQCENCKCLKIETDNSKWENLKYHCIVKEGDYFCDSIQKSFDAIMIVENIKDMGELIKRIKLKN